MRYLVLSSKIILTFLKIIDGHSMFSSYMILKSKLDKEKNQCIREKNGSRIYSKGNKTAPGKVATTRTENGHKQNIKTSVTI